jgi:DNA-binding NarL/FixJ family response regulator
MSENPISVFACEPQPIVLEGLARVLATTDDIEMLGAAPTLREAMEALRTCHPDVLLVDQSAGLKIVLQFIADVRGTWPHCQPVLWVNELAEIDCFRALQLGARGILKKTFPVQTLLECLRTVGHGGVWIENSLPDPALGGDERRSSPRLTPRERDIVHHVCGGLKNKEIALALSITAGTVKVHLMHIFEKTGVKDRFELAVYGRRLLGTEHANEMQQAELSRVETSVA